MLNTALIVRLYVRNKLQSWNVQWSWLQLEQSVDIYPAYILLLQDRRFEDKEIILTFILSLFMFAAACLFAAEMEECIVGKSCDTSRPGIRGGVEHSNKTAEKKTLRWAELGARNKPGAAPPPVCCPAPGQVIQLTIMAIMASF